VLLIHCILVINELLIYLNLPILNPSLKMEGLLNPNKWHNLKIYKPAY